MAGIYVHIPFCKKRCSYCDFHFSTTFSSYRSELIAAICLELVLRKDELNAEEIQTIYFGGGTPSLLNETELSQIMECIHTHYQVITDAEITFEVNPDDAQEANLRTWKKCGINRLSIGLQSFQESDLNWMNRSHTLKQGTDAVRLAQAIGFTNISIDLIYGLPDLSNEQWLAHLNQAVSLKVQHISSYCLTIEPKTVLLHQVQKGKLARPSEDQQSEQFELMVGTLKNAAYEQYEISNFAKDEMYARHNSSYWNLTNYIGVGPSAHSFNGKVRRWNIANNTKYYQQVGKNDHWFEQEVLSDTAQWNECFLTGLRTKWGVSKEKIERFGGFQATERKQLESYLLSGLMVEESTCLRLTEKGKLQADGISSSFFRLD